MPCPFGFTADNADDGDVSEEEEEPEITADSPFAYTGKPGPVDKPVDGPTDAIPARRSSRKQVPDVANMKFDFEKDPVSWFYQNQIKSEAEFAKKKDALREEARKRLDQIMQKKDKRLEWPDDSDFDELSIRSSELSDLDSDVDSLGSIVSCANSWIADARYGTPAENTLTYAAYIALAVTAYCVWLSLQAVQLTRKVAGVLTNSVWPTAGFLAAAMLGGAFIGVLAAVRYRSRRMLLISQATMLMVYSGFLIITCGAIFVPTAVDPKLHDVACVRYSQTDQGSRLCKMLPAIERELSDNMDTMKWVGGLAASAALACLGCSVWYLHELAYIEKKAIKHKRRHKRRKHSIPWDKIKIVGPTTTCGGTGKAAGAGAAGAAGGGKCPIMHGGSTGAAAVKGGVEKKND